MIHDALVVGRGPAGLAIAAELASRGSRVASLAPQADDAGDGWPAEYGAWADELEEIGGVPTERVWPLTEVVLPDGAARVLERAYARVEKRALRQRLLDRCQAGGVVWRTGAAVAAEHDAVATRVRCETGEIVARVVVDASGHRPAMVQRPMDPPPAFQTAFGLTLRSGALANAEDRATLMDWRGPHAAEHAAGPPSFLYAMPLGGERCFVEETVLAARPAIPPDALEPRLRGRLSGMGIDAGEIVSQERVWIPMGGALPNARQRVVGFGGAAGMVHPTTGYLLARVLRDAPPLAAALTAELGREGGSPAGAASAAWETLWSPDRRRRHALFCFGLEVLLGLDREEVGEFFATFFELPEADWRGYLDDRLTARRLAAVMGRFYLRAPPRLRSTLTAAGAGSGGLGLAARLVAA